ncbi:hypothetical protein V5799_002858, partial [Amblyomma americanum]
MTATHYEPTSGVSASSANSPQNCVSSDCATIRSSLLKMLGRQVDPCRNYNTYVCDSSDGLDDLPQPVELPRRGTLVEDVQAAREKRLHAVREGAVEGQSTFTALRDLCAVYGDVADAELSDAMTFLSVFKLNLLASGEGDEEDEDPLYRAMQLSLEFGVEPLLSFQRVFEYVVDASEPFRLEIGVSAHARDFFSDWSQVNREAWRKFYERCLSLGGLSGALARELGDELILADKEGRTSVPYGVILRVGNLMASVQNTAASVLLRDPSEMRHLNIGRSTGFPQSAWSADGFAPFWLLGDLGPGFLRDWLTTLRAWHVLPPVVQAHLALLARVVGTDRNMHRFFLPPHFYEHGLAAYNYAALGQ